MYPKAELLFPPRLIGSLRNLRGPEWAALVDRVAQLPETDLDSLAFTLLIVRLANCVKCHEGSFKYMRGCQLCSSQTVMQFKGTDADLIKLYGKTRRSIEAYQAGLPFEDEEELYVYTPDSSDTSDAPDVSDALDVTET